jgi:hypothetical protein
MAEQEEANYNCRHAGYLFIAAVLLFLAAMILAQIAYPCTSAGCYNVGTNPISDLGNTATSPLWPLFNYSLVLVGAMLFGGIVLMLNTVKGGIIGKIGMTLLAVSTLGIVGVGAVPENTVFALHTTFAAVAFMAGGVGILLVGYGLITKRKPGWFPLYSIWSGIIVLLLLVILSVPLGFIPQLNMSGSGFGFGGVERILAAVMFLWIFMAGNRMIKRNDL